jgi:hypothetical protein
MEESILEIEFEFNISIDIGNPTLESILKRFVKKINPIFEQVVSLAVMNFAEQYLEDGKLKEIIGCKGITKKSFTGSRKTKISTPLGYIWLPQLQVTIDRKRRMNITRILLGIEKWKRIPIITARYFGLMGALAPLRVVNKFLEMYSGIKVSLMSIVRSMRESSKKIELGVDTKEKNEFEADGTGIPIISSGKRGKELKVLAQRKRNGGIRIAGMAIGRYKDGWEELLNPLKISLKAFKEIFLVTDGDTSPLDGLQGIKVIIQRCLFHIAHELKYTLWKDKVKRKSEKWVLTLAKTLEITSVKRIREGEEVCAEMIAAKKKQLVELIEYCDQNGFVNTTAFLKNAQDDIFSGIEKRISGGTTSLIERVMRTVNQRINVAKWSKQSALAVAVLRGAYYYNGYNV